MGFFDFIFGKTIKIQNDFFGSMIFMGDKNEPESYFECNRHFKPSNEIIDIAIDGTISGPTQKQVGFYKYIEDNYKKISESVIALIEGEYRNMGEDFRIVNFKQEFRPVYLKIPKCEDKNIIWEITFEAEHDKNLSFLVTMQDLKATEIFVDS